MNNIILNTDSYKASHFLQYPPGTTEVESYIESRGGEYDYTVFAGLQGFCKRYLMRQITDHDIQEAKDIFMTHGEPFNEMAWYDMMGKYHGHLPLEIKAVKEGSIVPTKNVLVTVKNTDPQFPWLTSYIETALLRAIWYPTTVATISHSIKKIIEGYLIKTGGLQGLPFKLHDFGSRGVSSLESSGIGGFAHLINFQGTDNVPALMYARNYYNEPMAGLSIPAAEHSTITSWGKAHEISAYDNMLEHFAKPGKMVAVVSDSYDLWNAIANIWGHALKQKIIASGATVIIRPDSGDPVKVVKRTAEMLDEAFGHTINLEGYRVLNHVRIIQGDGINEESIKAILAHVTGAGYSAENISFGMGGALLQHMNRDTLKFAMKASNVVIDGEEREVFKQPATDFGKASKKGRQMLYRHTGTGEYYTTIAGKDGVGNYRECLETVYRNGTMYRNQSLYDIRRLTNE